MGQSWKVEKHTGSLMELQRDERVLQIAQPIDAKARFIFAQLRVGQILHDPMVHILTGNDMFSDAD